MLDRLRRPNRCRRAALLCSAWTQSCQLRSINFLLFTGEKIDAQAALAAGLVNTVVSRDELETTAKELALRIAPTPLAVLRLTKQALNRAYEAMGLREAVNANIDISAILNGANTPEQQEFDKIAKAHGVKAALRWRDARYRVSTPEH